MASQNGVVMRLSFFVLLGLLFINIGAFSESNPFLHECETLLKENGIPESRFLLDGGFKSEELRGAELGIDKSNKEVVLTFDDGPSEKSLELAKFLAKEGVPATFFMNGKNLVPYYDVAKEILELKLPDGSRAHNISNHTWNHEKVNGSNFPFIACEIFTTDKLIQDLTKGTDQIHFFRPPHGFWTKSDEVVNGLNNFSDLSKIIGPVHWDIGGTYNDEYSSDWQCWKKGLSVKECTKRYLKEIEDKRGGIVLLHDTLEKSVEMVMGKNGLVKKLKSRGYKFVKLGKDRNKFYYQELLKSGAKYYKNSGINTNNNGNSSADESVVSLDEISDDIFLFYSVEGEGRVDFEVKCLSCDQLEVYRKTSEKPVFTSEKGERRGTFSLNIFDYGYEYFYLRGYKDGKLTDTRIEELYIPKLF